MDRALEDQTGIGSLLVVGDAGALKGSVHGGGSFGSDGVNRFDGLCRWCGASLCRRG